MLESSMKERQTKRIQLNDTPREAVSLLLEILLLVDWIVWTGIALLGTNIIIPSQGTFEDDFPFPKVGYVRSLEFFLFFLKTCFLKAKLKSVNSFSPSP